MNRAALLVCLLMLTAATAPAHAERSRDRGRSDQDAAREALRRGEVMPLSAILAIVDRRAHGQVMAVELEREQGRLVYEIDVLSDAGRMIDLWLDARTGEVIRLSYR